MRHLDHFDLFPDSLHENHRQLPANQREFEYIAGIPGFIQVLKRRGVSNEYWIFEMEHIQDAFLDAMQEYMGYDMPMETDDINESLYKESDIETMATDILRGTGPLGGVTNKDENVWTEGDLKSFIDKYEGGQGFLMRLNGPEETEYVIEELLSWIPPGKFGFGYEWERRKMYKKVLDVLTRLFPEG